MALSWQPIDLRDDTDAPRHAEDPAEVIAARDELLELARRRPWWHQHAACRGVGPDRFFPRRGGSTVDARQLCAGCTVRDDCLEDALAQPVLADAGIWAGTSARERRRLRTAAEAA